jgi:hypothetical protein
MTYKPDPDSELSLWNEEEGFYFDAIQWGTCSQQLPIRSLVGLIPLYATLTLEPGTINRFPGFKKRMEWFLDNRSEMSKRNMANMKVPGKGDRRLLALADKDRLVRILERMLDEDEFFSDFGIRSYVPSFALFPIAGAERHPGYPSTTRTIRTRWTSTDRTTRLHTGPAILTLACLAVTPIGVDQSGWRRISSLSSLFSAFISTMGTTSKSSAPLGVVTLCH